MTNGMTILRSAGLLAVALAGAAVAHRLGVPAGVLIGALVAAAIYRLLLPQPVSGWRVGGVVGRLLMGIIIGCTFSPETLVALQAALLPMLLLIILMVGLGLGLGFALNRWASLDLPTALVSSVPGGLPAMAAVAGDLGADGTIVSAVHFSRLTAVLLIVPAVMPLLTSPVATRVELPLTEPAAGVAGTLLAILVGACGALLARGLRLPTADMMGALLVVGTANSLGARLGPLDDGLFQGAMLLIGISVGAAVSIESLRRLKRVALPAFSMIGTLLIAGLFCGWLLWLMTPLDLATALLSAVPGGAATMPAVAGELGGDMRLVAALHLTRQVAVFLVLPLLLRRALVRRQA